MPRRRICGAMILLIASVACGRDPRERPSEYYPTHANAVAADAVLRGFVPGWVPPSATDIHAQADLDSGDVGDRIQRTGGAREGNTEGPRPGLLGGEGSDQHCGERGEEQQSHGSRIGRDTVSYMPSCIRCKGGPRSRPHHHRADGSGASLRPR